MRKTHTATSTSDGERDRHEFEMSVEINWLVYGPKYKSIPKGQKHYLIANVAAGTGDARYGHNETEHQFAAELVKLRERFSDLEPALIANEGKATGFNMHASLWHRLIQPETCPTFEHALWAASICRDLQKVIQEGATANRMQRVQWVVETIVQPGLTDEQIEKLLGKAQLMFADNVEKERGPDLQPALP